MAESVDALVSNTSGAIHPGSIPGLGTESGSREICFPIFFYPFLLFVGWLIVLCYKNRFYMFRQIRFFHPSASSICLRVSFTCFCNAAILVLISRFAPLCKLHSKSFMSNFWGAVQKLQLQHSHILFLSLLAIYDAL
mgnify:CR=1 FL=1